MMTAHCQQVLIITNCFAIYRKTVFRALTTLDPSEGYQFSFATDPTFVIPSLALADPSLSRLPVEQGGLRWFHTRTLWFKRAIAWQRGVLAFAWSRKYPVLVMLSDRRYLSTWIGTILARMRGKTVLYWGHGYRRPREGVGGWLFKLFHRLPHGLLFYNNRACKLAEEAGFDPSRLFPIYNSLDFDTQRAEAQKVTPQDIQSVRQRFAHPDAPILIASARLTAAKQFDLIIHAQKALQSRGRMTNLLIIGDGPEKPALEALAKELGLQDHVSFYGACYEEHELAMLFCAGDLFVNPGPLGLGCMHGMAYGLPMITNDRMDYQGPEVEAIVPGKTGAFYRDGDMDSLTDELAFWIDRVNEDRETIRQDCIRQIDKTWTADHQVQCILGALRSLKA